MAETPGAIVSALTYYFAIFAVTSRSLQEPLTMTKRKRIIPIESTIYIEPDGRVNIVNCPKEMVELVQALSPNKKKGIIEFQPIKKKKTK